METIKTSPDVEFNVIYADGTRKRVSEGVLFDVDDNSITFHNGTNRLSVLFAVTEAVLEVVGLLGCIPALADFLLEQPVSKPVRKLFGIAGAQKQAVFRLGQMDMRESAAAKLRNAAANVYGIARATLESAADMIDEMETLK